MVIYLMNKLLEDMENNAVRYKIEVTFNPDDLIQAWADNNDIPIKDVDVSVEEILESEASSWLSDSNIYVLRVEEQHD